MEASLPSQQKPLPPHVRFWGPPVAEIRVTFASVAVSYACCGHLPDTQSGTQRRRGAGRRSTGGRGCCPARRRLCCVVAASGLYCMHFEWAGVTAPAHRHFGGGDCSWARAGLHSSGGSSKPRGCGCCTGGRVDRRGGRRGSGHSDDGAAGEGDGGGVAYNLRAPSVTLCYHVSAATMNELGRALGRRRDRDSRKFP